ncbi:MAG: histidine phosphatase family protein [Ferrovum sp.]|jgi:probable phosphoglycerate mutase|uniref:histidine phosphatase family protein n=1 Tax=Ferrovum sp. TaxID=2609467 RepID=UPI002613FF94|nr:histidine phosphatase family protein [Ferrovum sp.]MBW8067807.1 histidine phosphatase family protein [Ferrovum sp.]
MQIILTRHGQVEGIDPPRFRGRMELELTPVGRQQAAALARAVASQFQPDAVVTSPRKRCQATGAEVARVCGVSTQVHEGFDDFDYGQWQWKTHAEVGAEFPAELERWQRAPQWMQFPEGESLQAVALRTTDALRALFARHKGQTVVLVAHDSVNRVILMQALDLPLSAYWRIQQEPCCINLLTFDATMQMRVLRLNDAAHLHALNRDQ